MNKRTNARKGEFKRARNEYIRIRREDEKKYERNAVHKCKEAPKLFYGFLNGKMKQGEWIKDQE